MQAIRFLCISFLVLSAVAVYTPGAAQAASAAEIDVDARNKAEAILVYPSIVKAGIAIGGEYGEGVMHIRGKTAGYYNIIGASFGFQLGVQTRSVIIMFMTPSALAGFQSRAGFKVGVDGSVALVTIGVGGNIDTNDLLDPIIGFVFNNKGLMYNLTLEGTKITRIRR